jgi:hypothetical protein
MLPRSMRLSQFDGLDPEHGELQAKMWAAVDLGWPPANRQSG